MFTRQWLLKAQAFKWLVKAPGLRQLLKRLIKDHAAKWLLKRLIKDHAVKWLLKRLTKDHAVKWLLKLLINDHAIKWLLKLLIKAHALASVLGGGSYTGPYSMCNSPSPGWRLGGLDRPQLGPGTDRWPVGGNGEKGSGYNARGGLR